MWHILVYVCLCLFHVERAGEHFKLLYFIRTKNFTSKNEESKGLLVDMEDNYENREFGAY